MIKLFYKLFNHDKIDDQNRVIDIYKERNEQLEAELREYKGYKLKYEVTKLYVEDDEALLELLELAKHRVNYLAQQAGLGRALGYQVQDQYLSGIGASL
jgi:hypothetical protein